MASESQIQEASLEFLNIVGCMAWPNPTTGYFDGRAWRQQASRWALNGVADVICVKNGIISFIEFKTPLGKQSGPQVKFEKKLTSHGGNYYLVRSVKEIKELYNSGQLG